MGAIHSHHHHHHHTDIASVAVAGAVIVGGAAAATEGSLHPNQLSGKSISIITLAFGALGALGGFAGGVAVDILFLASSSHGDYDHDSGGYSEVIIAIAAFSALVGAAVGLVVGRILAAIVCLPVVCVEEAAEGCTHVRATCCPARDARVGVAAANYGTMNIQPVPAEDMPDVRTFDADEQPPSYQQASATFRQQ